MDGPKARLVTAPHTDLLNLTFDPEGDRAWLYLAQGEDMSGTFDVNEGPAPFVLDLMGSGPAQALIEGPSIDAINRALESVDWQYGTVCEKALAVNQGRVNCWAIRASARPANFSSGAIQGTRTRLFAVRAAA